MAVQGCTQDIAANMGICCYEAELSSYNPVPDITRKTVNCSDWWN